MTTLSIMGSTGSVGQCALDIVARAPDKFTLKVLTAHSNVGRLIKQAHRFLPEMVVIAKESLFGQLKEALAGTSIRVGAGPKALEDAASLDSDKLLAAISGTAGLASTVAAVRRGAFVALANKESLVCAGDLLMQEAKASGACLFPVDSEHNALFRLLEKNPAVPSAVPKSLILTASGGPFHKATRKEMEAASPEQALAHPVWRMGPKISVDSATLMNKGLELIEAHHLFAIAPEAISILVHPQSIVHGMVEHPDGSLFAYCAAPDMSIPLSHALFWPHQPRGVCPAPDLAQMGSLTFERPRECFRAPEMARAALQDGQGASTILNAANEIAVEAFLGCKIGFMDIILCVEKVLSQMAHQSNDSENLEAVLEIDARARALTREVVQGVSDA